MRRGAVISGLVIALLAVIALFVWCAVWQQRADKPLTVSFLNVGEGDAIFITAPSGNQVLIDGGPDASVVRELGKVMPWYDHSIDFVIATHPDADHITGLIDVLDRYTVTNMLQSSVIGTTHTWQQLEDAAMQRGVSEQTAHRGQRIDLGDGAYLAVLWPDRSLSHADTNDACVVTRLVYGSTAFLFPCDAPQGIEKQLVQRDGEHMHADVLKAGHHGSKTSSSELFVGYVSPSYAIFSRGCKNKYGFPSPQTVDTMKKFDIPTLDTCTDGTITFESDGEKVMRE